MRIAQTYRNVLLVAIGFLLGVLGVSLQAKMPEVTQAFGLAPADDKTKLASACSNEDADNIYFVSCGGTF